DLELTCRFRVADVSEPVAICLGYIDLPLTGSGTARLFADQVDWFSYDNCGIETYEVRRQYYRDLDSCEQTDTLYWGEWGPFVEFSCCDAGYQYDVELRVIDSAGLINFCTAEVNVYDGIRPYCVGLDNLDLTCNDLPDGFDPFDTTQLRLTFGMPEVIDNCSAYAVELDPIVTGDGCTPNGIVRRFLAVDEFGNEAFTIFTQVIMIDPVLDYSILFPRDTETDCVSFEDTVGVFNTACDSITISFEDVDIEVEGEECRHVARTYTVTNWCEWDGDSPAFVLSRDEECDFIEGDEDLWVIRRPDTVYLDANSDETDNFPAAGTSDVFCTGETNPEGYWRIVESTGRWQYTQHIRYFDTLAPVVELFLEDSLIIEDDTCEIEADFIINLAEACPFGPAEFELAYDIGNDGTIDGQYDGLENFDGELIGVYPDFIYREIFPIGTHRLELTASDACGNTVVESLVFQVYDGYVPPLTCYDYRLYELEQLVEPIDVDDDGEEEEAAVAVQAEELGSCLFDDCSGELTYSLNRVGETPDPDRSFLFLDCDDRYSVELEVYVWDAAFNPLSVQPDGSLGGRNWRSCVVTVWVQDPDLACDQCLEEEGLILSGTIRNSAGQRMEGVSVTLDELSSTMNTSSNGRYQFQLPAGSSDVLRAYKNDDTQDGLNTLDMLILNRHILGAQLLTTPHLLIAADINNDGEINILDMLELQRVILNVQDEFANNYSWRFVSSDWSGEYPPAEVHIEDMTACLFDINLTGIKIGDLDGSLTATPSADGPVSARLQESVVANERELVDGQRAEITFRLQDLSRFQGGQLGFQWDADRLEVEGLSSSSLADHNFNTSKLADGRLWFNWATTTGDELVTLQLKARARLNVKDEISLMTT
ncbi:MAG: dockerin type I domain-containing protein, partial [Bacteroidota bacterium]